MFELRNKYREIFHEKEFEMADKNDDEEKEEVDSRKVYKVSYHINMLPMLGEYVK